ncbi:MAG: endonuclease/exonuclease/phosphatase family protein [Planctomycetes bacterium]|nr:endonuclease/exonuclease/phosphatase family protein [Planctomycetota bacterium]
MAKAFSVASWNVEHFGALRANGSPQKPIQPIVDFIAAQKADVVAIYEVRSSLVFQPMVDKMPGYQFHITEGPQAQEILIGIKKGFSGFVTQKLTFKAGQAALRPGVLVTLTIGGKYYPLVFLHLKSMTDPKGFGLRDDMLQRALNFRKVLNKAGGGNANYIFLGDLNTMGMNLTYSNKDVTATEEITRLKKRAGTSSIKMKVLDKPIPAGLNHQATYWPGSSSSLQPGNLDHVVAADHLKFKQFGGVSVKLRGWPEEPTSVKRDAWAKSFSDHALLYFEVQKV